MNCFVISMLIALARINFFIKNIRNIIMKYNSSVENIPTSWLCLFFLENLISKKLNLFVAKLIILDKNILINKFKEILISIIFLNFGF